MHSELLVAGLLIVGAPAVFAQSARELEFRGVAIVSATEFYGAGVGGALRTNGRTRFGLSLSLGDLEGTLAGRAAAVVTYHLHPFRRRGVGPYAGGGISLLVAAGTREYVVLLLGVEGNPGTARGWFVEAGFTGGAFVTAGVRFRWRGNQG